MTLENRQVESVHVRDTEWLRAARWGVFMHFLFHRVTSEH